MRIDPFTALRIFFTNHYRVVSEERMDELYDISQHNDIVYDEEEIRADFQDDPISCLNDECKDRGYHIPTDLEVSPTYGNKSINIVRTGICPTCKKESKIHLRLKNGYIMHRQPDDNWVCIVRERPLLHYYVGCVILTIKELFS